MSILRLFSRLETLGIALQLVDGNLKISAPKGKLTPILIEEIKNKKAELIEFLQRRIEKKEKYAAIEPVEQKEYYPLSSVQKRLYILQQLDLDSTPYNMPVVMELAGALEREKLETTFRHLILRHESLRTSVRLVEEEPVRVVRDHRDIEFCVEYDDSSTFNIHSFVRPFNLSQAPLLRVGLTRLEKEKHLLVVDMHHIISDGVSLAILIQEFKTVYAHGGEELPGLRIQYKDYVEWQACDQEQSVVKQQENYWLGEFGITGEIPVLNLPTDYTRPAIQGFEGRTLDFGIGGEDTRVLKKLTLDEGVTMYMVFLSIYTIFLSKLSSQEDIIVGSPVAGRKHAGLKNIIGMFVNTLSLRNFPAGEMTFRQFLGEVKDRTLAAFANQDYPYEDLVEVLVIERDASRNPLFDTLFALQNIAIPEIEIPGLKLKPYDYERGTSKFDLSLIGTESGQNLSFGFEYSTGLFQEETIRRFTGYFKRIIAAVVENSEINLSQIEIIPEEEKRKILIDFNDTQTIYPAHKTIHELFEEQVTRTPDYIAAAAHHTTHRTYSTYITYTKLNKKSDRLAQLLKQKGVKPGTIAGIMVERSMEMIIGILGILKAGGAYMPIDPEFPQERISYMLKDSRASILLKSNTFEIKESEIRNPKFDATLRSSPLRSTRTNPDDQNKISTPIVLNFENLNFDIVSNFEFRASNLISSNLAYILYTSGSTGRPKGVVVEHGAVVNLLYALSERYPLGVTDAYLLKTSFIFDVSVTELFGCWLGGGRLVILEKGGEKVPQTIIDTIEKEKVTHINFVPSMFSLFLDSFKRNTIAALKSLKYIFAAGEALTPELVRTFNRLNTGIPLENLYGPTEAAVYASGYSLSQWKGTGNIPIGKPLQNMALYILDMSSHLQPVGVCGELCIAGAGVAMGYLNNPELTAERFLLIRDNIQEGTVGLAPLVGAAHGKRYRTGDLCRWLPDGNIEFLGRTDEQVKVRGFRIELGEIENHLLSHEAVKETKVIAKEDENREKYLVAYVVLQSVSSPPPAEPFTVSVLREHLAARLPHYMNPSYFILLEKMPLTSSGKIDRKSLPEPGGSRPELAVSYLEPQTDLEIMIADIWKEVLKVDKIGIDDSFFELGGNSLDIIKVNNRIKQAFQVDMPVINMFRYSTLRLLAGYLKNDKTNESFTNKKQKIFKAVDRSRSRRREGIPKWRPPAKIERRLK